MISTEICIEQMVRHLFGAKFEALHCTPNHVSLAHNTKKTFHVWETEIEIKTMHNRKLQRWCRGADDELNSNECYQRIVVNVAFSTKHKLNQTTPYLCKWARVCGRHLFIVALQLRTVFYLLWIFSADFRHIYMKIIAPRQTMPVWKRFSWICSAID